MDDGQAPTSRICRMHSSRTMRAGIVYFVFDLLHFDGEDLREKPLRERKGRSSAGILAGEKPPLKLGDHADADGTSALRPCLQGEGSKESSPSARDRPYTSGRSKDWLKIKCVMRQEMVIAGLHAPEGCIARGSGPCSSP